MATSSIVTSSARLFTLATSEYLSIPDNASLSIGDIDASGTAWVKLASKATIMTIFSKFSLSPEVREYTFGYSNTDDRFQIIGSSGGTSTTLFNSKADSFGSVSTGIWYFVMWRYDASADTIEISVNDGTKDSDAHAGGIYDGDQDFRMGAINNIGPVRFWDGSIGPVSIWKKKLSDAEVTSLYNSGVAKFRKDYSATELTSLVGHWDLVETSGIAYDAQGSNNLTDNNTVTSGAGIGTYTAEKAGQFTAATSESLSITNATQTGLNFGDVPLYIAAWVYFDTVATDMDFVAKWNTSQLAYNMRFLTSTKNMYFGVSNDGSASTFAQGTALAITAGKWVFFEGIHDPTGNTVGIAINRGTVQTAAHTTGIFATSTAPFEIGSSLSGTANFVNGRIGSVAVIGTAIPTTAERDALFLRGFGVNNTAKPTLSSGTYVSWWELNEESGTRSDSIGTNHLTDNNTVTQADGVVLFTAAASSARRRSIITI